MGDGTEPVLCSRCVMISEGDPAFVVDEKGVCNYCHAADDAAPQHQAEKTELPWIIDGIKKRGRGRKWEALIGLSGGVDSSWALHQAHSHGLRLLAYQVDNGWNTSVADENVMRLVETLKVPFYRHTINYEKFRELQRCFVKAGVKNIEIPSDHMILATQYKMAYEHNIKTIISGGNWQTESVMPESYGYQARDLRHIQAIFRQFAGTRLTGVPTLSLAQYLWMRNVRRIRVVNLLDYAEYDREKAKQFLAQHYGWKDYGGKHQESRFTQYFQEKYLPLKFKIDKRRPHYSSMIHSGQMRREEALRLLKGLPSQRSACCKESWDHRWSSDRPSRSYYICLRCGKETEPLYSDALLVSTELGVGSTHDNNDLLFPVHDHTDYPTNEHWEKRWSRFFNVLKKFGYSA